jgi:hypothetical protein
MLLGVSVPVYLAQVTVPFVHHTSMTGGVTSSGFPIPWDKLLCRSWLRLVRRQFREVLSSPPCAKGVPGACGPLPSAMLPSSGGGLPFNSGTGPFTEDSESSRYSPYSGLSPFFVPPETVCPDYEFNSAIPGTQVVTRQGYTPLSVCRALLLLVYGSFLAMISGMEPLWAGWFSPSAQKFSGVLRRRHCLPRLAGGSGRGGIRRVSRSRSGSSRETAVPVVYITGAVGRASELHSWFRKEADNKFHFPHAVTHGKVEGTYIASFRSQGEHRAFVREFGQYTSPSPWLGVQLHYSAGPPGSGESVTPLYTGSSAQARPKGGYGDGPKSVAFKLFEGLIVPHFPRVIPARGQPAQAGRPPWPPLGRWLTCLALAFGSLF